MPSGKIFKGTVVADGAGNASFSIVTTGYRFRSAKIKGIGTTGGLVNMRDGNGAGPFTIFSQNPGSNVAFKSTGAIGTAIQSPVAVQLASVGAGKTVQYELVLQEIPTTGVTLGDPASFANLRGWYDLSDRTTLYQDAARTVPVTGNGQAILGVADKSSAGNHLTSTVGPTWAVGVQNGRAAGAFSPALSSRLVVPAATLNGLTNGTFFFVAQSTGTTGTVQMLAETDPAWGVDGSFNMETQSTGDNLRFAVDGPTSTPTSIPTTPTGGLGLVMAWMDWGQGANNENRSALNGTKATATAADNASTPWTNAAFYLGARPSGPTSFWNGYIAEAIFYARALTVTEVNHISRGLATKYGITYTDIAALP